MLTDKAAELSVRSLSSITDVTANSTLGEIPWRGGDNKSKHNNLDQQDEDKGTDKRAVWYINLQPQHSITIYAWLEKNKLHQRERLQ